MIQRAEPALRPRSRSFLTPGTVDPSLAASSVFLSPPRFAAPPALHLFPSLFSVTVPPNRAVNFFPAAPVTLSTRQYFDFQTTITSLKISTNPIPFPSNLFSTKPKTIFPGKTIAEKLNFKIQFPISVSKFPKKSQNFFSSASFFPNKLSTFAQKKNRFSNFNIFQISQTFFQKTSKRRFHHDPTSKRIPRRSSQNAL